MGQKTRYQLICTATEDILFEGWFETLKQCVETAVREAVCLDGVDLTGANLANANLDDVQMAGANLTGVNLNGANLSEGVFDNAIMHGTDLSNACFALSSLMNVDMTGASFAATDVTDAVLSGCQFSCPSVFTISLHRAAVFSACTFIHETRGALPLNKPPVTISGLTREIVYLDTMVKIGGEYIAKGDLIAAGDRHLEFLYGRDIAAFLRPALYESVTLF